MTQTIVKKITVGTPTKIGNPSVGRLAALDDVNPAGVSDTRPFLQFDSDTQKFVFTNLPTVTGLTWDDVTARIVVETRNGFDPGINIDLNPFNTSDLVEGDRKYYTKARVDSDIGYRLSNVNRHILPNANEQYDLGSFSNRFRTLYLSGSTINLGALSLEDASGTFVIKDSGGVVAPFDLSGNTTDDLAEGSTNLYYTSARADSDSRFSISLVTSSGNNDLFAYDAATGVFDVADSDIGRTDIKQNYREGIDIADGKLLTFNTSDATIGTSSNTLTITNSTKNVLVSEFNGGVNLYYSGFRKIHTTDSGATVTGTLRATQNITVSGGLTVNGEGGSFAGTLEVGSTLGVTGNTTLTTLSAQNTTINGTLSTTGLATLNSASVTNNATVGGTLGVTGEATFASATVSDLSNGRVVLAGGSGALTDNAGLTFNGTTLTANELDVTTNIAVTGNATIDGTLTVNDPTTINDQLTVTQATALQSTLAVTGAATFSNNLTVNGGFTANDGVSFSHNIVVDSDATIHGDLVVDQTSTLTGAVSLASTLEVDGATTLNNNLLVDGNTTITGNLTVNGTTTTINSTTVSVNDKNLVLADSAANATAANGAGITIGGANATITYNSVTDTWDLNKPLGDNVNHLTNFSTTDLAEGNNLYYTTARADSDARYAIDVAQSGGDGGIAYNPATGIITYTGPSASEARAHFSAVDAGGDGSFSYNSSTGEFTYTGPSATEVRAHFTGGTGLAFNAGDFRIDSAELEAYFKSSIQAYFTGGTGITRSGGDFRIDSAELAAYFSTDNITEGSNLYYTTARANSDFDTRLATKTTDNLTEGSNLYYTRARFDSALGDNTSIATIRGYFSAGGDLSYNSSTGQFYFDVENVYTKSNFDSDFNVALDEAAIGGTGLTYSNATNTLHIDSAELEAYYKQDIRGYISVTDNGGDGALSYNASTGVISYTGPSAAEVRAHLGSGANVVYDSANGKFSITDATIRSKISVLDNGGDGSLSYNSGTGVLTYTGPSATEVRAHLVAGTGAHYDSASGVISIGQPVETTSNVTFNRVTNTTGATYTSGTGATVSDDLVNVIDTVAHNSGFMSIEYVVHMDDNTNSQSQISKLLLTYNKSTVNYTEYGMTSSFTGDSDMGTLSADVVGSDIRLKFQRSAGLGSIVVKAVKTVIS